MIFRAIPMLQVKALVLERDKRTVLHELGSMEILELTATPAGPETAPLQPRDHIQELAICSNRLSRIEELRSTWSIPSPAVVPIRVSDDVEADLRSIEQRSQTLTLERQSLQQRQTELAASCEQLSGYLGLELPLEPFNRSSFLHFTAGTMPVENMEQLPSIPNTLLLPLRRIENRQALIAITTRQNQSALDSALAEAGFRHEPIPLSENKTADVLFQEKSLQQRQATAELEKFAFNARAFANEIAAPLATIEHQIRTEQLYLEAERNFPRTESSILLTGWIAAPDVSHFESQIRNATAGRCVIEIASPSSGEQPPVLLRHPPALRPFSLLVSAYGLPRYNELDPTLFVAVAYMLMFGMMFGDAGQGSVLALVGLILRRTNMKLHDAGLLLIWGGIASTFFGVIYGSYFGIEQLKPYALWHDPMQSIDLLFYSVAFGVLTITTGMVLNIINQFRNRNWIDGCFDKFGIAGVLFYWGAVLLITESIHSRAILTIFGFLILPIIAWAAKDTREQLRNQPLQSPRKTGGIVAAVATASLGSFEAALMFFANTISFVRLAAYAMSHAALMLATFMLATAFGSSSTLGLFLSISIIVLGNLVAILLEGVIAAVQALRLEYYEFFSKFFSGEGRPFKPFRLIPGPPRKQMEAT